MLTVRPANKTDDVLVEKNSPIFGFLQSDIWQKVVADTGRTVERVSVHEDHEILAVALLDWRSLPFGQKYVFCPKGPVLNNSLPVEKQSAVYNELVKHVKDKGALFLRVEPHQKINLENYKLQTVPDINPKATLVLSLAPTADQIIGAMHQKTRYNIRLAEKKGVKVEAKKSLDIFWNLIQSTGARDNFRTHTKSAYGAVLNSFSSEQLVAFVQGKPVASAIYVRFGSTVTYLYGASDHAHREYMAPYLMQWAAITRAQAAGAKEFDFFGIATSATTSPTFGKPHAAEEHIYESTHRYSGVTRFKLGFGGKVLEEPGTTDLIISAFKYRLYQLFRKIRKLV